MNRASTSKIHCCSVLNVFRLAVVCLSWLLAAAQAQDHPTLAIGSSAPDFDLPAADGKRYQLDDFSGHRILFVVFTCNHCPTAQSYEDRLIAFTREYGPKGVGVVAISPNDPKAVRLDELGYTDLNDTLEEMKIRAEYKGFNFPYLYDGDTQEVSKQYGAVATPHVFVFDENRRLRYAGRFDSTEERVTEKTIHSARNAVDALLQGKPVPEKTTKVFGCSVKWSDKRGLADQFDERWAGKEVKLEKAGAAAIRGLAANKEGDKLRLINVWATWCGPCVVEFPEFVKIQRMYGHRDFEVVTISADRPKSAAKALQFLERQEAACRNFIFDSDDSYELIEAVDPKWQGALPYTLLVKPGGEILYRHQGLVDPLELKREIVAILGREKDW